MWNGFWSFERCQNRRKIYRWLVRQVFQHNQQNVVQQKHAEGLHEALVELCKACAQGDHAAAPHEGRSHVHICKGDKRKQIVNFTKFIVRRVFFFIYQPTTPSPRIDGRLLTVSEAVKSENRASVHLQGFSPNDSHAQWGCRAMATRLCPSHSPTGDDSPSNFYWVLQSRRLYSKKEFDVS